MLWDAGQARTSRETRDRMTELYVGVRDGYVAGNVALRRARWKGGGSVPAYVAERPDARVRRSPEIRDRALAKLGAMYPGMVRRGES
jgi:hypothetical protein